MSDQILSSNIEAQQTIVKTDPATLLSDGGDHPTFKYDTALIEQDCPKLLCDPGMKIAAQLDKARKYQELSEQQYMTARASLEISEQHYMAAGQLLVQVRDLCDEAGFDIVREKFFPELGRSRAYEILAIATGLASFFESASGCEIYWRIPYARRAEVSREFLRSVANFDLTCLLTAVFEFNMIWEATADLIASRICEAVSPTKAAAIGAKLRVLTAPKNKPSNTTKLPKLTMGKTAEKGGNVFALKSRGKRSRTP
jgi:hypothetical protein